MQIKCVLEACALSNRSLYRAHTHTHTAHPAQTSYFSFNNATGETTLHIHTFIRTYAKFISCAETNSMGFAIEIDTMRHAYSQHSALSIPHKK